MPVSGEIDYARMRSKSEVRCPQEEATVTSSQSPISTLRTMPTYCFRPPDHADTSSNWGSSRTLNRGTKPGTVRWTMILWIDAPVAVGRCSRPHSHGAVAAVPPQVQEAGQGNLAEKQGRRDRNDVFGAR